MSVEIETLNSTVRIEPAAPGSGEEERIGTPVANILAARLRNRRCAALLDRAAATPGPRWSPDPAPDRAWSPDFASFPQD